MTGILMAAAAGASDFQINFSGPAPNQCAAPSGSCVCVTGSTSVSITGGVGPFNYAYTYVSGTNATIDSPASQNSTFRRSAAVADPATTLNGTFRLTVTDTGNGNRQKTVDFTVTTNHLQAI